MSTATPQLNDHNKIAVQRVQKASLHALCRAIAISPQAKRSTHLCRKEILTYHQQKTTLQCIDNMHYSVAFSWRISLLYLLHNALPYPPHCITHKLETTCLVKIFGSQYQSPVSSTYKFFHR